MSLDWEKQSQEEQKVGFKVIVHKHYKMPNGVVSDWTTWGKIGTLNAAVIALTPDNQVVIARQFRPGPEGMLDELPGGAVDPGENPEQAAAREMLEETGYASDEPLEFIGNSWRDAYKNEYDNYFLARNCTKRADQQLGENEFVTVELISIDQLITNAKTANMTDAVAVLMAYEQLKALETVAS